MKRCHFCNGILWPWQSFGWKVLPGDHRVTWHGRCFRRIRELMEQEADQWEQVVRRGGI